MGQHLLKNTLTTSIIKLMIKLAFTLFLTSTAYSAINVAIIDTGFCPQKISSLNKNIKILEVIDFTQSVKLDCQKWTLDDSDPRFHGQRLLQEFLNTIDTKKLHLVIRPIIIFNQLGEQSLDYWLKAIRWVKENHIDIVVSASGLILLENQNSFKEILLSSIWFLPSGRMTPKIKKDTHLFPQALAPRDNLFLIGDYYDGGQILYDQALLYQDKIDYYFPAGTGSFKGTSRAVAIGAGRAINLCSQALSHNFRQCLKLKSKEYFDSISKRVLLSY
jgi:hypothetical protein